MTTELADTDVKPMWLHHLFQHLDHMSVTIKGQGPVVENKQGAVGQKQSKDPQGYWL